MNVTPTEGNPGKIPPSDATPGATATGLGSGAGWQFAYAMLGHLLGGKLRFRHGHLPPAEHDVPDDFAGVGVAASEDPTVDDFILERLSELGVRGVRLDFTYGDSERPAGRLLARLCDASFRVMLHLVQPFDAASRMDTADAARTWRRFVSETLDRYGAQIACVEIGSTVNRRRWAGYTLNGFLAAWAIAHEEVRRRAIVLAGPNVTDFEPPYNVGLLAIMKRRGQLPDIHTDNLFSERCTEPERYDHKILGHRLAPLIKYNLVKKARLLQRIGEQAGVPRLQSPAAFWTLPRIERILPDSEQKQADYLARYMILCAASGALERACWGPLICHREGLIDNGPEPYPVLERITHYAGVNGSATDLRLRPAFHAFAGFARLIPQSTYQGRLNRGQGLEVHAFRSAQHLVHAVWTINGRAAALEDLYEAHDIDAAQWSSRDGGALDDIPTLASEAPLYARWPATRDVGIRASADLAAEVRIHRHGPGQHFFCRDGEWQGMVLAKDRAEADMLIDALHPERVQPTARDRSLRHARNAIWTVDDPRTPGAKLVVKQPVRFRVHKRLLDRFKPSKALRSWNGANELLRRGIATATPVAWFEQRSGRDLTRNWYVCEYVEGKLSVRNLFAAYARGAEEHAGIGREEAFAQLSAFLLRMHARGVFFRDLSAGNILVRKQGSGELEFLLIDTARAHFFAHGLPLRKRLADLVRTCNKLDHEGRERFMTIYLGALGRRFTHAGRLSFLLYDLKVRAKRRFRGSWLRRLTSW
ncbi:MAG TPA: lipopolysaccharide kinase InaA family protein [Rhodocyclaceae bacterium]|nr:lipopolysaccharide kinase InaA family protein [Rhodocyclaceae bacterium]HRQ45635.1 lipopolysaccharide kinase InaA family protein [Rhodocyclaceae bacterium]